MSATRHLQSVSVQDYLDGEADARFKHEYVNGYVYMMSGARNAHNLIKANCIGLLFGHLRRNPCRVFDSDTKVRIRNAQSGIRFYYPDAMVVCQLNPQFDTYQDNPVVILEVLSESTRRLDEHEKRLAYLTIDSLRVYILLEQSEASAAVYRRTESGFDTEGYDGLQAIIPLPEIECELSLAEVYEHIDFSWVRETSEEYDIR